MKSSNTNWYITRGLVKKYNQFRENGTWPIAAKGEQILSYYYPIKTIIQFCNIPLYIGGVY